ncbi:MAG TPA: DUF3224 domain-containing protein [Acidimicrobiales bacterium]|jgi:hypothetical protein|nr:DUF3224 domain-containing protein [Acidimicrobiales bacterium]
MDIDISASFDVKSWDETPFDEEAGLPKVTRAVVTKSYAGDIDGTSTTQWLMSYAADGSATFVGLERIAGSFAGRPGSLVVQHVGAYKDGVAKGSLSVAAGGSQDLAAAQGAGEFVADPAGSVRLNLTLG